MSRSSKTSFSPSKAARKAEKAEAEKAHLELTLTDTFDTEASHPYDTADVTIDSPMIPRKSAKVPASSFALPISSTDTEDLKAPLTEVDIDVKKPPPLHRKTSST